LSGATLLAGATPVAAYTPSPSVGMSTSKPVSSDAPDTPQGVPSRKRTSPAVLGGVAFGAVAILAFAGFQLAGRSASLATGTPPQTGDSTPLRARVRAKPPGERVQVRTNLQKQHQRRRERFKLPAMSGRNSHRRA
jgi:hypothetical protein